LRLKRNAGIKAAEKLSTEPAAEALPAHEPCDSWDGHSFDPLRKICSDLPSVSRDDDSDGARRNRGLKFDWPERGDGILIWPESHGNDLRTLVLNVPAPLRLVAPDKVCGNPFFLEVGTFWRRSWCRSLLEFGKADKVPRLIPAQIVEVAICWTEIDLSPGSDGVTTAGYQLTESVIAVCIGCSRSQFSSFKHHSYTAHRQPIGRLHAPADPVEHKRRSRYG
jgi:hypothetical protein